MWWSVLLVTETRRSRENHQTAASHWQTLSHDVLLLHWAGVEPITSVVIGTDCIGSCKSNYHMITATTVPLIINITQMAIGMKCLLTSIKRLSDLSTTEYISYRGIYCHLLFVPEKFFKLLWMRLWTLI